MQVEGGGEDWVGFIVDLPAGQERSEDGAVELWRGGGVVEAGEAGRGGAVRLRIMGWSRGSEVFREGSDGDVGEEMAPDGMTEFGG